MIDTLVANLKDLELFRGLDEQQLSAIVRTADRVVFKPGQTIIKAGDAGDGAFVIAGGDAEVVGKDGEPAHPVVQGSLVGELAMLIEHEYRVTIVASTSVRALKLPRTEIHRLMLDDRSLADHFVDRISKRLSRVAIELKRVDQTLALAAEALPA